MKVLVTGGCGFIGRFVVAALVEANHEITVLDDLSNSTKWVPAHAKFIEGTIADDKAFVLGNYDCVVHLAALATIDGDAMAAFDTNVSGTIYLLRQMKQAGIKKMVFDSSAAIYGPVARIGLVEGLSSYPMNAYGQSKLMGEQLLKWAAKDFELRSVALRLFNVIGAEEKRKKETHLVPNVIRAIHNHAEPCTIYGDGSMIRDYVDVREVAQAFVKAVEYTDRCGNPVMEPINIGSGKGTTTLQVVKALEKIAGGKASLILGDTRVGDPPQLIAEINRAGSYLQWKPTRTLEQMLQAAYIDGIN